MTKKDINPTNDPNDRDKNGMTGPCIEKTLELSDIGEKNSYQFGKGLALIVLDFPPTINKSLLTSTILARSLLF